MTSRPVFRTVLFAGSCLILAACGDSTAPKEAALTVDSLLAELNDVQALGAPALSMGGGIAASSAASNQPCPFNSSNQRFVCGELTMSGLTMNRYYQLLDASNAPLSSFDVTKVAAIRNVTDITGTPPGTGTGSTITAHDDGTLSGLLTGTHTMNSTGTSAATVVASGQTITINTEQTVTNLVLPKRGSKNQYPQSGTIAMKVTSGVGAGSQAVNITMTFNGTSKSTFTMSANGFTQTCTIDLSKQAAAPVCS